ncbi:MAG: hypothetical protein P8Y67_02635 [Alphaproteobacteria bacterium]
MMKTLFGLILLVAIVISGFWLAGIYTPYISPNGEYWVMLNSNLPMPAKKWACQEIQNRVQDRGGQAPGHCAQ